MNIHLKSFGLLVTAIINKPTLTAGSLCYGDCAVDGSGLKSCIFTSKIDLHAGELGYFYFEECGEDVNPTLGIEKYVTYYFVQSDITNYYHPLGFFYDPVVDHGMHGMHGMDDDVGHMDNMDDMGHMDDMGYMDDMGQMDDMGHMDDDGMNHMGMGVLEPGAVPPDSFSTCDDDNSCPAPMYIKGGVYLGEYSNNDAIAPITDSDDFGLNAYRPEFFLDPPIWHTAGTYEVALKFDVDDFTDDIFYSCHIHKYMSGRMKFVDGDGNPLNVVDSPPLGFDYDVISPYDESCGTYGLNDYQLPHEQCPSKFVCDKPETGTSGIFAGCIESMNCAMTMGMTTNMHMDSSIALFIHQMIPHHQNAVNMCKALFATDDLDCEDLQDEMDPQCAMTIVCMEIINGQNHQIQTMRRVLEDLDYAEEDDCEVPVGDIISKKKKVKTIINKLRACSIDWTWKFEGQDGRGCGWVHRTQNCGLEGAGEACCC